MSLEKAFSGKNLSALDRSFATALGYGTISRVVTIDAIISEFSKIPISSIESGIRNIIRIGVWQIFWSKSIPDFAACNESVNLAKKISNKGAVAFVNGLLRNIIRERDNIENKYINNPKDLYIRCSLPRELSGYFKKWFGNERAITICDVMNNPQPPTARVNTLKSIKAELISELEINGYGISGSVFMENAFTILTNGSMLESLPSFKNGEFVIQDEAAMLVGIIASPNPGDTVYDLCAAPGGKTCHMGELMHNSGIIVACDIHPARLELVRDNADKLGITIIDYKCLDASKINNDILPKESADIVLADVPCSGLGILGKKPDIRLNMTHEKMISLYPLQHDILKNAASLVNNGGNLIYSTCTMNPIENQDQIERFIEEHKGEFEMVDISSLLPDQLIRKDPTLIDTAKNGMLNLYPDLHECDGFFIAKMKRKKNL